MHPTMEQYTDVERQVHTLCANSGLSHTDCMNARLHTTNTYIEVHLQYNNDTHNSWVLRFRYQQKGKMLPKPTLFQVLLDEDQGKLVPVKLVDGNQLPWGYT